MDLTVKHTQIRSQLEYVSAKGDCCWASVAARSEAEAIAALQSAVEAKLLWHFSFLKADGTRHTQTRALPWPERDIPEMVVQSRLAALIKSTEERIKAGQSRLLGHIAEDDQHSIGRILENLAGHRGELAVLVELHQARAAGLAASKAQEFQDANEAEAAQRVATALSNLNEDGTFKSRSLVPMSLPLSDLIARLASA